MKHHLKNVTRIQSWVWYMEVSHFKKIKTLKTIEQKQEIPCRNTCCMLCFKYAQYLYNISGWGSRCTLHTGVRHCGVHCWRRELLLMHAWIGDLGTMLSLNHGLRGPRGHWLGLRVRTQWSHDGSSDGGRRGVVLWNLLNDNVWIYAAFLS